MIQYTDDNYFHMYTANTSYIIKIGDTNHINSIYYGKRIREKESYESLNQVFDVPVGLEPTYSSEIANSYLNTACLEWSSFGRSDLREPPIHIVLSDNTRVIDLVYTKHQILNGKERLISMPCFFENGDRVDTLIITLVDTIFDICVELHYNVFYDKDIITRHVKVINNGEPLTIDRIMSFNIDFGTSCYDMINLSGHWIKEKHIQRQALTKGIHIIDSKRLASGAEHTPFIALVEPSATEHHGDCYGFSLVYSGNYQGMVQVSAHDIVRVQMGINPFDFTWNLGKGDSFVSPEVVMTFSPNGLNGMSQNFHKAIRENLITKAWQYKERPILFNSWEAMYFDFNEHKLLKLASEGKTLGMELFVLDDGWFGKRDDDTTSLGDWYEDYKKLPNGLEGLSKKIKDMGLQFGLWVEPEMISQQSDLFRAHPDWAIMLPNRKPCLGRNQLMLDLSNEEATDYLYDTLSQLFIRANVDYVKWDFNRSATDMYSTSLSQSNQQSLSHRYYLGLYSLLQKLMDTFPNVLFESCASGGNRHDLGMLYYMPQTWISDNTDAMERLNIQYGGSLLFPLDTMGAHVGSSPSHQTLRKNPMETRYNVAAFGALGYELNLLTISNYDKKTITKQIEHYKKYRSTIQLGTFYRLMSPFDSNNCIWMSVDSKKNAVLGYYQKLKRSNPGHERIRLKALSENKLYDVCTREHYINIEKFGELINHVLPIKITTTGIKGLVHKTISNNYLYKGEIQKTSAYGDELMNAGLRLYNQFMGTGLSEKTMLVGDFGSRMYNINIALEEDEDK